MQHTQGHFRPVVEPVCPEPKVFVGQIPFEVTQEQVYSLFSQYGSIQKCAIITGPDGRSKGCAMVTYSRWAEAELAVESENGTANLGGGKQITVKFANPPRGRGDGPIVGVAPKKLFVGQIPNTTTQEQIRQLFSHYGNIVDIHVLNKGTAPACAFVTFERWAQAEAALEAMNGSTALDGSKGMSVKFADAKTADMSGQKRVFGMDSQFAPNKRAFTGGSMPMPAGFNPYAMGGMGYDMSAMMGGYGMMGNMMGAAHMPAMMGMHGQAQAVRHTGMGTKPGAGSNSEAKAWKLFVGQVPFEATEADLWPVFSQCGTILELVLLHTGNRSKGCAFVTYETREMAEKAMQTIDGKVSLPNDPKGRLLVVKYATNAQGGPQQTQQQQQAQQQQAQQQQQLMMQQMGQQQQMMHMQGMPGALGMGMGTMGMAGIQGMPQGMMPMGIMPGM